MEYQIGYLKKPTIHSEPNTHPEEGCGIEDPRITRIIDIPKWTVTYISFSPAVPLISIAITSKVTNIETLALPLIE